MLSSIIKRVAENQEKEARLMAAEEASRAKTSFLATMSHEMRTPMNVILGLDNLALNHPNLPDETRQHLEKIGQSGRHLLGLINNILEMAIEDLGYSTDTRILAELNHYPIIATHAHTRPFRRRWMNILTGLVLPVGIFFYFRMIRFRLRLYQDLRTIRQTSERIIPRATELAKTQGDPLQDMT
jgi:hypothetical protein